MTKPRIINLTAHEARAFQRGATMLVREVKPQPRPPAGVTIHLHSLDNGQFGFFDDDRDYVCPFGQPGDLLIGREAWRVVSINHGISAGHFYTVQFCDFAVLPHPQPEQNLFADLIASEKWTIGKTGIYFGRWRSAAVMPQWAARVRRIVTDVSLKRCQELTEGECEAAGYERLELSPNTRDGLPVHPMTSTFREAFAKANAKLWAENKFVWVTRVKEEK